LTTKAVVFAYHNVGARCLRVLRAQGIEVPLVVTHADDPGEAQWFERVADTAEDLRLPWIAPADANTPECVARIADLTPDFVFSFYYRRMLSASILALPRRGALNMHGSLLPRYRGRAPVNWAVLHGERETGATLHYMIARPDAGDIVAQQAVPILPDDTAREVADKVTVAAEICLDGVLPALVAGTAPRRANDIARGSYFGGRTPEDGRIDWMRHAREIHNLVRAVAPPYPAARTVIGGVPARILRTRLLDADAPAAAPSLEIHRRTSAASTDAQHDGETAFVAVARCGGGGTLRVDALEIEGRMTSPALLHASHGGTPLPLG
jgi:methionyl-tRNA formyltransferase